MIRIEDIQFHYAVGDFLLRLPLLHIDHGSTVALIGPSGTGKTTLLHLVAGITLPQAGLIKIQDVEVTHLGDADRRAFRISNIGLVFQEFELLEYLHVLDNILLPYRINPSLQLDRDIRERARELAHQVGIGDKLYRYVNHLSQGERQRVAVCRALLPQPQLLLADEPTGNLDPSNKQRVLDILFEYARTNPATLVTVTHDHDLLERFDRVIDFRDFHDSPPAAAQAPAHVLEESAS